MRETESVRCVARTRACVNVNVTHEDTPSPVFGIYPREILYLKALRVIFETQNFEGNRYKADFLNINTFFNKVIEKVVK